MDNDKNDLGQTLSQLRNKLQSVTSGMMNKANKDADNMSKRIEETNNRTNSILDRLSGTIERNMEEMKKYGVDESSPRFMLNYAAEQIHEEREQKLTTSSTEPVKETRTSQNEKQPVSPEEPKVEVKLLDKKKVKNLGEALKTQVFGQDDVIEEVVDILKVSALNIKINKQKPAGCYLFAGPSGVGKTELAQSISNQLGVPLLKINMGEYGLENDVTKLIGTSKGYVGYNEGGLLTNFVKEHPACVVLFDELEKAHPSIDKILLSIMDHGMCTSNKGEDIHFTNTIIISTSNLGAEVEYSVDLDKATKNKMRMEYIKSGLRPEIINRYDSIFHFNALSEDIYRLVANKFLAQLDKSMQEEHDFSLKFTPKLVDFIIEKSYDPAMGGRPARKFIEKIVIKPLADQMLEDDFEQVAKEFKEIVMDLNKDSNICFKSKRKILGVLENTQELVSRIEENKFTNQRPKMKP